MQLLTVRDAFGAVFFDHSKKLEALWNHESEPWLTILNPNSAPLLNAGIHEVEKISLMCCQDKKACNALFAPAMAR